MPGTVPPSLVASSFLWKPLTAALPWVSVIAVLFRRTYTACSEALLTSTLNQCISRSIPLSHEHILSDHVGPWNAVPLGADLTFGFDLGPKLLGLVAMSHDHLFVVDPARAALLSVQRFNGSQFERVASLPARLPGRSLAALHHVSPLPSNSAGINPRLLFPV